MKKKLVTSLLAGALSASMVIPAFATTATPNNTGVYPVDSGTVVQAGVIVHDADPVVRVEVPTLFAFVVNGSTSSTDPVTSSNGNIYLPQATVAVDPTNSTATLTVSGESQLPITNYSTYEAEDTSGIAYRTGLGVTINGEIQEKTTDTNHWKYDILAKSGERADFKKYRISIDGSFLDQEVTVGGNVTGYQMASGIALGVPNTGAVLNTTTNTYDYTKLDSSNLSTDPYVHKASFDVVVGGQRNQYTQIEQSAQVGTIVWTVSIDVSNGSVQTAPNNDYLAIDPGSSNNDTTPTPQ